jgi:hypothetical protein
MKLKTPEHAHVTRITTPCRDGRLEQFCLRSSGAVPSCEAVRSVSNARDTEPERGRIVRGEARYVDLFVLKEELAKTGRFQFRVASWSMFPALMKGDVLDVGPFTWETVRTGDVVLYRRRQRLYAHRVIGKEEREGKRYVITRADTSGIRPHPAHGEPVPEKEIAGVVRGIRKGKKRVSTEKRRVTTRDILAYVTTEISGRLASGMRESLQRAITALQGLAVYRIPGKAVSSLLRPFFTFERAVPFSSRTLGTVYKHVSLVPGAVPDQKHVTECGIFHVVMKCGRCTIGYATYVRRPGHCPYPGVWLGDVYVRLRYRGMRMESILLEKTKETLKGVAIGNRDISFPTGKSAQKESRQVRRADRRILRNTEDLLLMCARRDTDERTRERAQALVTDGIDWERFMRLSARSGMVVLIYEALKGLPFPGRIPERVYDRLQATYGVIASRSMKQYSETLGLLDLFSRKGIRAVPLKGVMLARRLYADDAARGVSADIDILVEKENREHAARILQEAGYSYVRNVMSVIGDDMLGGSLYAKTGRTKTELHWDICQAIVKSDRMDEFWKGIGKRTENDVSFYEPNPAELLLQLSAHFVDGVWLMELRYVCDIHAFLIVYGGALDWACIAAMARQWKLANSLYTTLIFSKNLFGSPVPEETLKELRPAPVKRFLIHWLAKKETILREHSRERRFTYGFFRYIIMEFLEASTVKDFISIAFPPKERIGARTYPRRIAGGIKKLLTVFGGRVHGH